MKTYEELEHRYGYRYGDTHDTDTYIRHRDVYIY